MALFDYLEDILLLSSNKCYLLRNTFGRKEARCRVLWFRLLPNCNNWSISGGRNIFNWSVNTSFVCKIILRFSLTPFSEYTKSLINWGMVSSMNINNIDILLWWFAVRTKNLSMKAIKALNCRQSTFLFCDLQFCDLKKFCQNYFSQLDFFLYK